MLLREVTSKSFPPASLFQRQVPQQGTGVWRSCRSVSAPWWSHGWSCVPGSPHFTASATTKERDRESRPYRPRRPGLPTTQAGQRGGHCPWEKAVPSLNCVAQPTGVAFPLSRSNVSGTQGLSRSSCPSGRLGPPPHRAFFPVSPCWAYSHACATAQGLSGTGERPTVSPGCRHDSEDANLLGDLGEDTLLSLERGGGDTERYNNLPRAKQLLKGPP